MEELLLRLKTRLQISNSNEDALLTEHLLSAIDVVNELRQYDAEDSVVEPQYASVAVMMAESSYNKIGAEGQTSHSENGVSRHYGSDAYPSALISRILPRARLK